MRNPCLMSAQAVTLAGPASNLQLCCTESCAQPHPNCCCGCCPQVAAECREAIGPAADLYFQASTFLRLGRDTGGRVPAAALFRYCVARSAQIQLVSSTPSLLAFPSAAAEWDSCCCKSHAISALGHPDSEA